ncbi:MAG: GFA family protein [Novosphingobium sp.]
MAAPYIGSCACGQVSVTITVAPVATRQCWCRQCQQLAGGGPTHNAMFPTEAVTLIGQTAEYSYVAASGNTVTHEFCPACGTPVLSRSSARPQFRGIRIGLLDPGNGIRPEMAIWTEDAPDWAAIDPALERHARQPPPPPSS